MANDMSGGIAALAARSATEIGRALAAGQADAVALTEHYLGRIEATRDSNTFISVTADRARAEAAASARRLSEGRPLSALDGVPIAWKDLFDVAGTRTTAASDLYRDSAVKQADAPIVANAAAAGMVCLGKLNMTEFAYSGLGLNPHFGTPLNPNDPDTPRSPGGSSSGSGASVAAGLTPVAIGTDTGGSVRIPASFNGCWGFKTSEGRIDKTGMIPLSRTLDTVGPLARSVEDCLLVDMALRGAVVTPVHRQPIKGVSIVVATNQVLEGCDVAVMTNFEAALEVLAREGALIERRALPVLDHMVETTAQHGSLTGAESYHEYHELVDGDECARMDGRVVHRIVMGKTMSAHSLLSILDARKAGMAEIAAEIREGVLAMPTTPITAPEVAPLAADVDDFHKVNLMALRNTMLGNFLGLCGLAMPSGRDGRNLPTSILFSAPRGRDDALLGLGLEIDRLLAGLYRPIWARG